MTDPHYICDSFLGGVLVDAVLAENQAVLSIVTTFPSHVWKLYYPLGTLHLGELTKREAREAAALFLYLLQRGVPSCLASTIARKTIEWSI